MEDDLDPRQLVRVVTEEEEAIVHILVVTQQLHDRFHNHFNDIGLFNQLSGLKVRQQKQGEMHKNRNETPY